MKNKTAKTILISILTVSLFGQFAIAAVAAETPKFNIFTPYTHTQAYNRDYYLLDIRNETKNTGFADPISADPGDILVFSVYYHNGANETMAKNTTMKVILPNGVGTQLTSTAYLWADNAENASASNPLSESGIVNVSSPSKLEYISGSAKWYPDQRDWRTDQPVPFPSGQTGDKIVSNGVNIDEVLGCWEYSGYINFKVRVVGEVLGTATTTTTTGQVAGVSVVTGANDIFILKIIASLIASISSLIAIYLIMLNFGYFTKLRLNLNTYGIRIKEKL